MRGAKTGMLEDRRHEGEGGGTLVEGGESVVRADRLRGDLEGSETCRE